jgi:hypothetical protein
VSEQTTNRSFDDLARAMAEGSLSRRRALKLFAGTAIAALIPSRAMAVTCPPGTVKICHIPFDDGRCRRGRAETRCVTPGSDAFTRHAGHRCDCCGECGATDECRENATRTCFSTPTTTTTAAVTPTTTTTAAVTPTTTTTAAVTPTTTTTRACIPDGDRCVAGDTCCSTDEPRECRRGAINPDLRCRPVSDVL